MGVPKQERGLNRALSLSLGRSFYAGNAAPGLHFLVRRPYICILVLLLGGTLASCLFGIRIHNTHYITYTFMRFGSLIFIIINVFSFGERLVKNILIKLFCSCIVSFLLHALCRSSDRLPLLISIEQDTDHFP
jgi:hypothetical protein